MAYLIFYNKFFLLGEIASAEYRALGITTALSPQIDLATEPRWMRFADTFGEHTQMTIDMTYFP